MPTHDELKFSYEAWRRRYHAPAHARRTAKRNAAFLLPYLSPGMRVLDAGCGARSITIGLAEAVANGQAIGVDTSQEAIDAARSMASSLGCVNLQFELADINTLPFSDAQFDAVFCHAVLQHLRDPLAGLRELRRVTRPGGVIGVVDADFDGSIMSPEDSALDAAGELLAALRRHTSGRDLRVGRHLRRLLHEAGYERVTASVRADYEGDPESVRCTGLF